MVEMKYATVSEKKREIRMFSLLPKIFSLCREKKDKIKKIEVGRTI